MSASSWSGPIGYKCSSVYDYEDTSDDRELSVTFAPPNLQTQKELKTIDSCCMKYGLCACKANLVSSLLAAHMKRNRTNNRHCYIAMLPPDVLATIAQIVLLEECHCSKFGFGEIRIVDNNILNDNIHCLGPMTAPTYKLQPLKHLYLRNDHVPRADLITWEEIGITDPTVLKEAIETVNKLKIQLADAEQRYATRESEIANSMQLAYMRAGVCLVVLLIIVMVDCVFMR